MDDSAAMRGIMKRFGGLKERQPLQYADGKQVFVDLTIQGPVVLSYHEEVSPQTRIEIIQITHGACLEQIINDFLAEINKPKLDKIDKLLKVNLNPKPAFATEFEFDEFKRLLLNLEKIEFSFSHFTVKSESGKDSEHVKVDIDLYCDHPELITILATSTVIGPRAKAVLICIANTSAQLSPLLNQNFD